MRVLVRVCILAFNSGAISTASTLLGVAAARCCEDLASRRSSCPIQTQGRYLGAYHQVAGPR